MCIEGCSSLSSQTDRRPYGWSVGRRLRAKSEPSDRGYHQCQPHPWAAVPHASESAKGSHQRDHAYHTVSLRQNRRSDRRRAENEPPSHQASSISAMPKSRPYPATRYPTASDWTQNWSLTCHRSRPQANHLLGLRVDERGGGQAESLIPEWSQLDVMSLESCPTDCSSSRRDPPRRSTRTKQSASPLLP
jgi:hypothetical protein